MPNFPALPTWWSSFTDHPLNRTTSINLPLMKGRSLPASRN
ncbi:hypothetical protein PSE305_39110 [Pseudomonas aeruginosa]|nr:hypothetical protein PSE305_39110 [Pseudomonas aeruginosa]